MLGFWRRLARRPLPLPVVLTVAAVILGGYGAGVFALTTQLFNSYRGLGLGAGDAVWFITSVYLSAIPLVGALLAYSFPPAVASPSEAIAALPISYADWYGPQVRRFIVGAAAVSAVTWAAVVSALANIFQLSTAVALGLQATQLGVNAIVASLLSLTVTASVLARSRRLEQSLPLAFTLIMAAAMALARRGQNGPLLHWAEYQAGHTGPVVAASALVIAASLAGTLWAWHRLSRSSRIQPLSLSTAGAKLPWLARLLPWRGRSLWAGLAIATLRGLSHDRKNLLVLASSGLLFLAFALAARLTHTPVLGSLLLSAAAAYFPIFLGLIVVFSRSWLGPQLRSIYAKPVSPGTIVGAQLSIITTTAALSVMALLLSLLMVLGHRVDLPELAGIGLGAAVTAAAAYLCGSLVRVRTSDQLSILGAIAGLFLLQAATFSLINGLQLSGLTAAAARTGLLLTLGLAAVAVERFGHLGGMVQHA